MPEWSVPMQRSVGGWSHSTHNEQDPPQAATWLSVPSGSVEMGLSPALSYDSQSSHTLNTLSEPEPYMLPPQVDFSFCNQPAWSQSGPALLNTPGTYSQDSPSGFAPTQGVVTERATSTQEFYSGPVMTAQYPQGGPSFDQRFGGLPAHAAPAQPSLPTPEGSDCLSRPVGVVGGVQRPHLQGSRSSRPPVTSVSNSTNHVPGTSQHTVAPVHPSGYGMLQPHDGSPQDYQSFQPEFAQFHGQAAWVPTIQEHSVEDFSAFIQFDPEDQAPSPGLSRPDPNGTVPRRHLVESHPNVGLRPVVPAIAPKEVSRPAAQPEPALKPSRKGASSVTSLASEGDEGRHRSHPLYKEGPSADGLYYCPFKAQDPNCPHKPTKLKCNYEYAITPPFNLFTPPNTPPPPSKFVDSHIKPFRCGRQGCAKQEFSSTACLLRHEREAHGMHGHGDRPHLCLYPGCERGVPGNGFPRRYNLFDHMKRVHDHTDDTAQTSTAPSPDAQDSSKRLPANRKRKSEAVSAPEPAARRQKVIAQPHPQYRAPAQVSAPVTQAISLPSQHAGFVPHPSPFDPEPRRASAGQVARPPQRIAYSHWANQRDLVTRQMDFVNSPADEVELNTLSRNIEEFRRLSWEARRV